MKTICAIATPPGMGGISVIRVSGEDAVSYTASVFSNPDRLQSTPGYTIVYGHILDSRGDRVDEVLVSVFRAPHSFTGEEVCEISCHGGMRASNRTIELLLEAGCAMAEPGEFTKRAFLNGKLTLTQAEAVKDIIEARTDGALWAAVNRLEGGISRPICAVRDELLHMVAGIQVSSDFPDEDVDAFLEDDLFGSLEAMEEKLIRLKESAKRGALLREGASCAIVGIPNSGKSSLLNALLERERAIVTEYAGTTRDIVEEWIDLDGIPLKLGDTAGIRDSDSPVEQIGVHLAKQYLQHAQICIFLTEAGRDLTAEEEEILRMIADKPHLVVVNKCDCACDAREGALFISAKTGEGLQELKLAMSAMLGGVNTREAVIANERQREAVLRALEAVSRAKASVAAGYFGDLAVIDLETAISALGEAEGISINTEIVNTIFEQFCLGK